MDKKTTKKTTEAKKSSEPKPKPKVSDEPFSIKCKRKFIGDIIGDFDSVGTDHTVIQISPEKIIISGHVTNCACASIVVNKCDDCIPSGNGIICSTTSSLKELIDSLTGDNLTIDQTKVNGRNFNRITDGKTVHRSEVKVVEVDENVDVGLERLIALANAILKTKSADDRFVCKVDAKEFNQVLKLVKKLSYSDSIKMVTSKDKIDIHIQPISGMTDESETSITVSESNNVNVSPTVHKSLFKLFGLLSDFTLYLHKSEQVSAVSKYNGCNIHVGIALFSDEDENAVQVEEYGMEESDFAEDKAAAEGTAEETEEIDFDDSVKEEADEEAEEESEEEEPQ